MAAAEEALFIQLMELLVKVVPVAVEQEAKVMAGQMELIIPAVVAVERKEMELVQEAMEVRE
jgi:hypothetical protein